MNTPDEYRGYSGGDIMMSVGNIMRMFSTPGGVHYTEGYH